MMIWDVHCHLSGEETGLWVPTGRWLAFGSAGVVLVLGLYQMTSTWTTRKKWPQRGYFLSFFHDSPLLVLIQLLQLETPLVPCTNSSTRLSGRGNWLHRLKAR